jgi:hypothetical protein
VALASQKVYYKRMTIATLFIIAGHVVVVMLLSVVLSRAGLSRNFSIFVAFIICGFIFGAAAYFVDSYDIRLMVNPFGARFTDWVYKIWDPALHDPNATREPSIPWIVRPPQGYIFMTAALYACIGALAWVAGALSYMDPRHYMGPSIGPAEEDMPEADPESAPETE